MTTHTDLLTPAFRALSARLGQDPLQVQGLAATYPSSPAM